MEDRTLGMLLLLLATIGFMYYVVWIGIIPLVDETHVLQRLFPPREFGLYLATCVLFGGTTVCSFVGASHVLLRTGWSPSMDAAAPPPLPRVAAPTASASLTPPSAAPRTLSTDMLGPIIHSGDTR
ncbi:dolichyl-phosphate mannosyltransferase polypeptide 2, regulatory subunit [Strigomonas culicis]|uniref:Dolichol phosphate-mannose biosynthesis regulatory protein n=1 Tax=Strigomonas culicis TaxID=28005 RepID=S9U4U9_9TRYP|nr:dolichyl-phosphate mannosyltransferase polypeptide 2, regulatory subunit [Strigomonas culicis]|eukprot:EPY23968.1 dolichyl-phosphate mannosyltransferase polypeptide 2, regulatory subunit [Strigomonas culicis]